MTTHEAVNYIIDNLGWDRERLANSLGVSTRTISRYKNEPGRQVPAPTKKALASIIIGDQVSEIGSERLNLDDLILEYKYNTD